MERTYIILIFSAILLSFLIWKEVGRKNRVNLILRLAASAMAVTALVLIALPISYQRTLDPSLANMALILTEGYHKDSITRHKNLPAFSTDQNLASKNKRVEFIPDLEGFLSLNHRFKNFYIQGYGLEKHELNALRNYGIQFNPSSLPQGIISVQWTRNMTSGEPLLVQGTYNNTSRRPVKLILKGLGTTLDSTTVAAEKTETFWLKSIPKNLGRALYSLLAISRKDTISNEKIPVIVEEQSALRVLILSSSPDFENKFLKNWLYEQKYALAVRTAISKDKFSTEFLNTERRDLSRINPSLLESFDVLIADMTELSRLNQAGRKALQNQVSEGMGLIIKTDAESEPSGFFKNEFQIRERQAADEKTISLNWAGNSAKKMLLPASRTFKIIAQPGNQALVKDGTGNILVSSKLYGTGRLVLSTIADSYTWMLGNNAADYTSYWAHILEKAARRTELTESIRFKDQYPIVNKEIQIQLVVESDTLPSAESDGRPLKFIQDPLLPFQWNASYWPSKIGWHSIKHGNTETQWYVFDKDDWKSIQSGLKIKNTKEFIEHARTESIAAKTQNAVYTTRVPAIYFFILFIVCCTYLWLEAKLL